MSHFELTDRLQKKLQLATITAAMIKWRFNLLDGRVLGAADTDITHTSRMGTSRYVGYIYDQKKKEWYYNQGNYPTGEGSFSDLAYCITTLKWRPVSDA